MKNALFSGISAGGKKKDEDSSDEEQKNKEEAPANEMNLLDLDSPEPISGGSGQNNLNLIVETNHQLKNLEIYLI